MAKKKNNPTVVNNIESVNVDIDYNKLAEAIVKAQEKSDNNRYGSPYTSTTFALMISHSFRVIAVVAFPISLLFGFWLSYAVVNKLLVIGWSRYIAYGIAFPLSALVSYVLGLFASLFWKSAKEIKIEKDKNYIVSVFSGIVSFAAFIIAIIALVKGAG